MDVAVPITTPPHPSHPCVPLTITLLPWASLELSTPPTRQLGPPSAGIPGIWAFPVFALFSFILFPCSVHFPKHHGQLETSSSAFIINCWCGDIRGLFSIYRQNLLLFSREISNQQQTRTVPVLKIATVHPSLLACECREAKGLPLLPGTRPPGPPHTCHTAACSMQSFCLSFCFETTGP